SVLSSLAAAPSGLTVKTLNVEVAPAPPTPEPSTTPAPINPIYVTPTTPSPSSAEMEDAINRANAAAAFARRYGIRGGGQDLGGIPLREGVAPRPTYVPPTGLPAPAPAPNRGGLPTVLDEKQLKLTVNLIVLKLLPPK